MVNHSNITTSSELVQSKCKELMFVVTSSYALQVSHADSFPLAANDKIVSQPVSIGPAKFQHCLCSMPILGDTVSSFATRGKKSAWAYEEVSTAFLALLTGPVLFKELVLAIGTRSGLHNPNSLKRLWT